MALRDHERRDLPFLLINPPLTDPTCPYHSISYLLGATESSGFHGGCALDANVEALNQLVEVEQVAGLIARARKCLEEIEHKPSLTRMDEVRYLCALKSLALSPEMPRDAVNTFCDPVAFYDYPRYRRAVSVIKNWIDLLSLDGFVDQFDGLGFKYSHIVNFCSVADLSNPTLTGTLSAPFDPYFGTRFRARLHERPWRLIGLSVNYVSQLPVAIHMTRLIREELPDVRLCLGGTELSDIVKQLEHTRDVWNLFPAADYLVVGEGEAALVNLLEHVDEAPRSVRGPGIMTRSALVAGRPQVAYEDLATSGSPNYEIWDWPSYWVPEPVILYSPTRGCYWNRCTFCDYGLNSDSPTSPSRERPIPSAVSDLQRIQAIGTSIYFAVDAMSPKYLRKLAAAIAPLKLSWSAELRLEKTFVKGLSQELAASGCVAISFGYESGSPRVLDLIDKGTDTAMIGQILAALREANIGAQMMGFVGFPSETPEEAMETYDFLIKHQDTWALAGIGDFVLTTQSIVAKEPSRFGIDKVVALRGDDIVRSLLWVEPGGKTNRTGDARTDALDDAARVIRRGRDSRPFVGGIDSSHSLLYFKKYGAKLWPNSDVEPPTAPDPSSRNRRHRTPFTSLEKFCTWPDIGKYVAAQREKGLSSSATDVLAFLSGETAPARQGSEIEILPNGTYLVLTPDILAVEANPSAAYLAAKQMLLRFQGV
jgi:hypothetical protein